MRALKTIWTLATACAVVAALATPAQADDDVLVEVTVTDAASNPVKDVDITLYDPEGDVYIDLGTTNASGYVSGTDDIRDDSSDLYDNGAAWEVTASDYSEERFAAGTQYADMTENYSLGTGGSNPMTFTMQPGNKITGKVTAPSGKAVKNVLVFAFTDPDGSFSGLNRTASNGTFKVSGLGLGTFRLTAGTKADEIGNFGSATTATRPNFTDYGQTAANTNITNWKVSCSTSFSVSSPKKGAARFTVKSTASSMGIAQPGGKVVIKNGSRTVKSISWSKKSGYSTTVTGQSKGKKVTYKAYYTGGDCLGWSSSKSVTIKKK